MELQLGDEQFRVVLDADAVAIVQVAPQLTGFDQHAAVAHRVLAAQRVALAQDLVQQVAKLPRHDPVLLDGLPDGDRPERVATLAVERSDDGRSDVFDLDGHLMVADGLRDAYGLVGDGKRTC